MAWVPHFKLYDYTGTGAYYQFPAVQETNIPHTTVKNTVIEGMRGIGCIVISGAEGSWDLRIRGYMLAADYPALTAMIDTLESAVATDTPYVLVFEKTNSSSYSYNVKRIEPIEYPESLRTDYQEYVLTLKANAW